MDEDIGTRMGVVAPNEVAGIRVVEAQRQIVGAFRIKAIDVVEALRNLAVA